MLITLRQAVLQKVQDKSNEDIQDMINNSVDASEQALPGLGVMFETIWKHCGPEKQAELVGLLQEHIPAAAEVHK
ncbi:spore protein [Paenibacillus swuensis]|uniref:Small, acid-soluble spore protein I n=1 Tax=Paenibacillus swuensis TaxID=1178515 RepID=A0A172TPD9_9BACL|nr:spore protein [Paenibacillus swuensis]